MRFGTERKRTIIAHEYRTGVQLQAVSIPEKRIGRSGQYNATQEQDPCFVAGIDLLHTERSGKIRTVEVPRIEEIDTGRTVKYPRGTVRKFARRHGSRGRIHGIPEKIHDICLEKYPDLQIAVLARTRIGIDRQMVFDIVPFQEPECQGLSGNIRRDYIVRYIDISGCPRRHEPSFPRVDGNPGAVRNRQRTEDIFVEIDREPIDLPVAIIVEIRNLLRSRLSLVDPELLGTESRPGAIQSGNYIYPIAE